MANYLAVGSKWVTILGGVSLFITVGIPLLSLIFFCIRMISGYRVGRYINAGMWSFWLVNLITCIIVGAMVGRQFNQGSRIDTEIDLSSMTSDTLNIFVEEDLYSEAVSFGNLRLNDESLVVNGVGLIIRKSKTADFKLTQRTRSRGRTQQEAAQLAKSVSYNYNMESNALNFSSNILIMKGEKWRGQNVEFILEVPEGKIIKLNEHASHSLNDFDYADNNRTPWRYDENKWQMGNKGMTCLDCPKPTDLDAFYEFSDFENLSVDGKMKVYVDKGDFNIRLAAKDRYKEKIDFFKVGKTLNVTTELDQPRKISLYITMPSLKSFNSDNTEDIRIRGFKEKTMSIKNEGRQDIKAHIEVDSLLLSLRGSQDVDIKGIGKYLRADLKDGADLDAEHFEVQHAKIVAERRSDINVAVMETLYQSLGEDTKISVDGDPKIIEEN